MILSERDFEKMAGSVMDEFFNNKTSLNDGILKMAEEYHLNPDQIKNLVCVTNVKTHLELFEKKADDKIVEFPVADPDVVLGKFYSVPEKTADHGDPLVDFLTDVPVKHADIETPWPGAEGLKVEQYKTASEKTAKNILVLRKVANSINDQIYENREVYATKVAEIVHQIRNIDTSPEVVLADIRDAFGKDASNLITDVANTARVDIAKLPTKVAQIVDTSAPVFKTAEDAINAFNSCVSLVKSAQELAHRLDEKGIKI